ncbi:MAG: 30S ribosome-binding factor RbfA [Gemmatimonadota bacterium]|jgi:ribosome-binding factor A|nr:30S ribosome-binding factor RbfA [Gemmatimonadota bacterium]
MPNRRIVRLNEQFRREIAEILHRDVRDPRVREVTVTGVEVTSDLWLARVYVSVAGDEKERVEALKGLDAASNFIKRVLGGTLHIRRVPELRFVEDDTLVQASRIEEILNEISCTEEGTSSSSSRGMEESDD